MVTCGSDPKSGRASPVELPPSPSLSPLWISWAENEGAEGRGRSFIFEEGVCRPPAGRQAPCRQLVGRQGWQAPSKDLCTKKLFLFIYTPSFLVYKARWNMARSSKRYFDHLFVIYYIIYDYKFIIIVNYIG